MSRITIADKLGLAKRCVGKLEDQLALASEQASSLAAKIQSEAAAREDGKPISEAQLRLMQEYQAAIARHGRCTVELAEALDDRDKLQAEYNKAYNR